VVTQPPGPSAAPLRGLVVDWGGVLTTGLHESFTAWATSDDIDFESFAAAMRAWLGPEGETAAEINPIYALERGQVQVPDFERQLAERLRTRTGGPVPAEGLLDRMFAHLLHAPDMAGLVRRAHRAGLRTALLSNSWGNEYPREGWEEMFDAVVISGEVGMRKPEPEIFAHTASLLGLGPRECVFVDDLPANVRAAVAVGMVGIHHETYDATLAEIETLFGRSLRA
jgi:epoxide hydrolase-like predicted phosphatase